jgi:hypothetical protein
MVTKYNEFVIQLLVLSLTSASSSLVYLEYKSIDCHWSSTPGLFLAALPFLDGSAAVLEGIRIVDPVPNQEHPGLSATVVRTFVLYIISLVNHLSVQPHLLLCW